MKCLAHYLAQNSHLLNVYLFCLLNRLLFLKINYLPTYTELRKKSFLKASVTHKVIHSQTHSQSHSLTHKFTHPLTHSSIHSPIHPPILNYYLNSLKPLIFPLFMAPYKLALICGISFCISNKNCFISSL